MEVSQEERGVEAGPVGQQHCDRDMQHSDTDDSDMEADPILAIPPEGDALQPEDDAYREEGVPPPEPEEDDVEEEFWDE